MVGWLTGTSELTKQLEEARREIARLTAEVSRVEGLERSLQAKTAVCRGLEQLLEDKGRELYAKSEKLKNQSRFVGQQAAAKLLLEPGSLAKVAPQLLRAICENLEWEIGILWQEDVGSGELRCLETMSLGASPRQAEFLASMRALSFRKGVDLPGRVWSEGRSASLLDLAAEGSGGRASAAARAGLHSCCAFAIPVDGRNECVVELLSAEWREVGADFLAELSAFGSQLGHFHDLQQAKILNYKNELSIARKVQTSILPRNLTVAGLEIGARMLPAEEVGGDYYDVLPAPEGCWLGIGDVSGHGLAAGLVMLMVQSAIAALSRASAGATPQEILPIVNEMLFDNIRSRLGHDDHVTLSLLRYHSDGTFRVAGAHEEIIVYRAAERRCQVIPTPGTWLGACRDIRRATKDFALELARGDVMWLYTDGLIEAKNGDRRELGLERVCAIIERSHGEPVEAVRDRLFDAVLDWSPVPEDDVTIVGLRYLGVDPPP